MGSRKHTDGVPGMVRLRLTENAFVGCAVSLAGTVHTFPEAEAKKRLTTEQFWELA